MSSLERAIEIASAAHAGQTDKAGEPYILHPLRVMMRQTDQPSMIVGVLHDVVEDTWVTLKDLGDVGFTADVIEAVDALSRRPNEDYYAYIERLSSNRLAVLVKLADLEDNLDPNRISADDPNGPGRRMRYRKATRLLLDVYVKAEIEKAAQ